MITKKKAGYILIMILLSLTSHKVYAQNIDEDTFQRKMRLIDSLSLYNMKNYDSLYHVSTSKDFRGTSYKEDYYGWIDIQKEDYISLLNVNGKEVKIEKKDITVLKHLPLDQETIDSLTSRNKQHLVLDWGNFAGNYELMVWLYKKGRSNYSKQLIPKELRFFGDTDIRDGFGAVYYDAMLSAFSYQRNYKQAIAFGEQLSKSVFKGYEYQKEALLLTRQLKNSPEDFKSFRLPDSLEWNTLKQKLSRKEQILYLADRLRLLNCIQPGQPAGISYDMFQYSIPVGDASKLNVSYWEHNNKYEVINPFVELLTMKLNLNETELLLPYLLSDTYIPSYNYHRDFFPERNLHKLNWVVEHLVFEITHKDFFDRLNFDSLTSEQKETEIQKIKKWLNDNSALSPQELTTRELKTANNWIDFKAAMQAARLQKNDSLLSIIAHRFNDFHGASSWPSASGIMAQNMFELGDKKYIDVVRKWSRDASDTWVNLWASMFLIKYDKQSYEPAMKELEDVLKQCDGTTYYPIAMNLLLEMKDKRALKLAEGILNKNGFQQLIAWDYYLNFVRKLLLAKSDYTFNFLISKLDGYSSDEIKNSHRDNDQMQNQNDSYVLTVDELKSDTPGYYKATTNAAKFAYITTLDKWFKTQYVLLKQGKPNELRLDVKQVNAPVTFVDSYNR